jgi:rRNA processing protein Krr1/Pno1
MTTFSCEEAAPTEAELTFALTLPLSFFQHCRGYNHTHTQKEKTMDSVMDSSNYLTHLAAIVVGVVLTMTLVAASRKGSDPTATATRGGATAAADTKKRKKKKSKTKATETKEEANDEEEEEKDQAPTPAPPAPKKKKPKKAAVPPPEPTKAPEAPAIVTPPPSAPADKKTKKKKSKATTVAAAPSSGANGTTNGKPKETVATKASVAPTPSLQATTTTTTPAYSNGDGVWQSPPPVEEEWSSIKDTKKKKKPKGDAGAPAAATVAPRAVPGSALAPTMVTAAAPSATATLPPAPVAPAPDSMSVDAKKIGIIIGPKGATMMAIQEATGCKLDVNAPAKDDKKAAPKATILLTGEKEAVKIAKKAIQELATKGYATILQGEGFDESTMSVHPKYLKEIVGSGGKTIKALQSTLEVKITIPPTDWNPNTPPTTIPPVCKVGIAGTKDNTKLCKEAIQSLMEYHHHEITHPSMIHEEVHVPREFFHCVIGTRGSEIKHIRGNYRVDVYMPQDDSTTDNVIVVGPPQNVEKAIGYIKVLMERDTEQRNQKYNDEYY